ncbi:hypothetical protein EV361DRAFT_167826 [Lentinula raphanica]|uniref:DUF1479-domain-containing protein n=1 Tax=Lentinula raphanica TaxID=153919 RepID=A0AA38PFA6_9AGAR|nr:hypothetical protein F5880DRAFT_1474929 [Lentinula raphanica]KAJ3841834.1 hypothetical protein F5878DRAFT_609340 [Lentinula raphanica]KAJ3972092.1 hypothetical protein EV361DRAFT_167826 [Lentinula raphanica]
MAAPYAEHFLDLKRQIAETYPDFEARATQAWGDIINELDKMVATVSTQGSDYIPQVKFSELSSLSLEKVEEIRRIGTVVIKDVVDDAEARSWQDSLKEFVKVNPDIRGFPAGDMQFFELYWTKPQVQARSHPNLLAASAWLNKLYRDNGNGSLDGVDLSTPLTYADRFRIRHPGVQWDAHPPHIDGGAIERWEDTAFRTCFDDILTGQWRKHDPYALSGRLNARSSLYRRPNQATVFRTFQGWLAMSETEPHQGTLKVFPNVVLSNAYIILRPFFRPLVPIDSKDILDVKNWAYDISYADFPGILPRDGGFTGPRPTPETHPHLMLEKTMTSVPKVMPGDAVFWHCDVVHSVELEHTGKEDSAVMYIPAMPTTPMNKAYVEKQKESFLQGVSPPDFPKSPQKFAGNGEPVDFLSPIGLHAMGLPISV